MIPGVDFSSDKGKGKADTASIVQDVSEAFEPIKTTAAARNSDSRENSLTAGEALPDDCPSTPQIFMSLTLQDEPKTSNGAHNKSTRRAQRTLKRLDGITRRKKNRRRAIRASRMSNSSSSDGSLRRDSDETEVEEAVDDDESEDEDGPDDDETVTKRLSVDIAELTRKGKALEKDIAERRKENVELRDKLLTRMGRVKRRGGRR